jgi:puromycin-sensitive aminopeptidase
LIAEVERKKFKRLPTSVVPINYVLTLKPDLKSFTFSGTETVDVIVDEETNQILLNSLEIEINSASFISNDGKSI